MRNIIIYDSNISNSPSLIGHLLEFYHFKINYCQTTLQLKQSIANFHPIALCIDTETLSYEDCNHLLQEIKTEYEDIPVIIFTSSKNENFNLNRLNNEGWDYYSKDLLHDFINRIENILMQHTSNHKSERSKLSMNTCFIAHRRQLLVYKQKYILSGMESLIMGILVKHLNSIVEKNELIQLCWNSIDYLNNSSYLYHYICRIRKYLEKDPNIEIETIRGIGYRLCERAEKNT